MERDEYVALSEVAGQRGWPSRNLLFALVRDRGIRKVKFPADRKTYVKRAELERAMRTPVPRARA